MLKINAVGGSEGPFSFWTIHIYAIWSTFICTFFLNRRTFVCVLCAWIRIQCDTLKNYKKFSKITPTQPINTKNSIKDFPLTLELWIHKNPKPGPSNTFILHSLHYFSCWNLFSIEQIKEMARLIWQIGYSALRFFLDFAEQSTKKSTTTAAYCHIHSVSVEVKRLIMNSIILFVNWLNYSKNRLAGGEIRALFRRKWNNHFE